MNNGMLNKYFPFFLIVYELAVNLSNDMYLPATAHLIKFFNTNYFYIQLTLTFWFAGTMMVNPILGILSDHMGRKNVLVYSGLLFLAATLYCSFPTHLSLFLLARFVQGMAVTSIIVCGYALIHEWYENKQAILVIAWMSGALIVAPMLGPLVGSYIMTIFTWHYIFISLFFLSGLALLGIYFTMPKHPSNNTKEVFSLYQEMRVFIHILSNRRFLLGSLSYAILFSCLIAWITASPFLIIEKLGLSPLSFGLIQIPIFASYILGILLLKSLLYFSIKEEKIIFFGVIGLSLIATIALVEVRLHEISLPALIIFVSLFSLLYGLIASTLNRVTVTALKAGMGKIMAMFDLMIGIMATMVSLIINVNANNLSAYLLNFIFSLVFIALIIYLIKIIYIKRYLHEPSIIQ